MVVPQVGKNLKMVCSAGGCHRKRKSWAEFYNWEDALAHLATHEKTVSDDFWSTGDSLTLRSSRTFARATLKIFTSMLTFQALALWEQHPQDSLRGIRLTRMAITGPIQTSWKAAIGTQALQLPRRSTLGCPRLRRDPRHLNLLLEGLLVPLLRSVRNFLRAASKRQVGVESNAKAP